MEESWGRASSKGIEGEMGVHIVDMGEGYHWGGGTEVEWGVSRIISLWMDGCWFLPREIIFF
jgi:hypothetical protein